MQNNLNLTWAFGFSKDTVGGVQSLCAKDRNAFFSLSAHSGVIYDFENRTQTILQGHCNIISCCVVDPTKRWIITADAGFDPILVVWDAVTCIPVKTFNSPHEGGVQSLDVSADAVFIATLSAIDNRRGSNQQIAVWSWTNEENDAILRQEIVAGDHHHTIKFNTKNKSEIVTTGSETVCFWNWDEYALDSYIGRVSKLDLGHYSGQFVSSIYLPGTGNAVTATSCGYVILWESNASDSTPSVTSPVRVATKVLRLVECGIALLTTTTNDYLVLGCHDGAVRFYDYFLRLEAWFEDLGAGPISSVTFADQYCPFPPGEAGAPGLKFWVPDFIVGTQDAFVVGVESALFDEVRKDDRRGTLLLQGMAGDVVAVACHPSLPLVAILCGNEVLQLWNYELKLLMVLREFSFDAAVAAANAKPNQQKSASSRLRTAVGGSKTLCVAFDYSGTLLAVGFSTGLVKLLNVHTLGDVCSFAPSSDPIERLSFSSSGNYLAGHDSSCHVMLFTR